MTRIGLRLVLLIAIGATIGCDRVTKHVAATTLSGESSRSFLAGTFRLEYAENTGAFLGLGANWPAPVRTAVFGVGNGLLLIAVAVVALQSRWPRRSLIGVAIFVALRWSFCARVSSKARYQARLPLSTPGRETTST